MKMASDNNKLVGFINKETFETLDTEQKLKLIYGILLEIQKEMKRKKRVDKFFSFIGGLGGGFLFWLSMKLNKMFNF